MANFQITQTGEELQQILNSSQTPSDVAQAIATALLNYYTKGETDQKISDALTTALLNYFTKGETEQKISDALTDALGGYYTKEEVDELIASVIVVDEQLNILKVKSANGVWYKVPVTTLKPAMPTINTSTQTIVVDGSVASKTATFTFSGSGTIYTKVDGAADWTEGSTVSINPNFTNSAVNAISEHTIIAKVAQDGEESDEKTFAVQIKPKAANVGISVNGGTYSTSRTVTFTASASYGVVSQYSIDKGVTWTDFTTKTHTITTTTPTDVAAGQYQVKIKSIPTGYTQASTNAKSLAAFEMAKPKFWWGCSSDALDTITYEKILALTGGGSVNSNIVAGERKVNFVANKGIWFCGIGTITNIVSGIPVPYNAAVSVTAGKYTLNCYRITLIPTESGSSTYQISIS